VAGVGAALVVLAGLQAWPAAAAGAPARGVDRDIEQYALFGTQELHFKGSPAGATLRGFIHGGDIGVNNAGGDMDVCANYTTKMDDGWQANADHLHGSNLCSFYDVYANTVTGNPPMSPRHGQATLSGANALPLIPNLPPFPSFQCDPQNAVTVEKHASRTLAPGVYGSFRAKDDSSVTLEAGTYTFCDFGMGKGVHVTNTSDTVLQIAGAFSSNNNSYLGPACDSQVYVRSDHAGPSDTTVSFGHGTEIHSRFWAPNAHINLGDTTDLFGRIWGRKISSDAGVNVDATGCGGNETTTTTSTTSTSFSTSSTSTTLPETTTTVTEGTTATTAPQNTTIVTEGTTATTIPSTVTTGGSTQTTTKTGASAKGSGSLPFTGSSFLGPILGAGALLAGAVTWFVTRRRRRVV